MAAGRSQLRTSPSSVFYDYDTNRNMQTGKELDMGGTFDYFGELSHPDYTEGLTEEQLANRNILREAMIRNGFKPLDTEWWHFTLENEPYPDTYFEFNVSAESVGSDVK